MKTSSATKPYNMKHTPDIK